VLRWLTGLATGALVMTLIAGCATAPPQPVDDGLRRVPDSLLDEWYVAPDVPLANYRRFMLDSIEVEYWSLV
jgi:hypothetical protein